MTINKLKNFLFKNTSNRQTAAKNAFWVSVGEIGSRLFRALIIIYAARVLGAEGYGVFAYVIGLAGFFTIFADIGISQILTRDVSKDPENEESYFATSFGVKSILLVAASAVIVFIAPYFTEIEAANKLLPYAALLVVFDNLRNFFNAYFRGKEKMQFEALLTVSTNIGITVLGFIILTLESTPEALTAIYAVSASIGALIGAYILRDKIYKVFKDFKWNLIKPTLQSAWPIALMGVLGAFMLNIDLVMLGYFESSSSVGLYSASQKIIGLLYTLPTILAASLFPLISRFAGQEERKRLKKVIERGITTIMLFAIPIAIGGVILSKDILGFLYGGEYLPATLTFQILALTPLLVYPGIIISNYILAHDEQFRLAKFIGASAIGNIILNLILIPLYGIEGSAMATIGANLIYNGGAWVLAKKINNFQTLTHLSKIVSSALIMGGVALIIKMLGVHVLINIAVCIGIYFALLHFLKEDTLSEIKKALPA